MSAKDWLAVLFSLVVASSIVIAKVVHTLNEKINMIEFKVDAMIHVINDHLSPKVVVEPLSFKTWSATDD